MGKWRPQDQRVRGGGMMLDKFLNSADAGRVANVLGKLHNHDISRWEVTGGFAIELHLLRGGGRPRLRPLHDIDFLVPSFDRIPETLGEGFLFRHIHPHDPPAKTLLQAVDADMALRVDVFRAYGFEMNRLSSIELEGFPLRLVSPQDLAARHARLCWDLVDGREVHPKYVQDFLRLMEVVTAEDIEDLWQEHRKSHFPENFSEALVELQRVIVSRPDLLVTWDYSTNANDVCLRCQETKTLRLATGTQIYSILGYV
jgi:hypothetical protein